MRRIFSDWRWLAASSGLIGAIALILASVAVVVRPYRDVVDTINANTERAACVTDARTELDVADADLLIALIDGDTTASRTIRAEIVVARDRLIHLDQTCPH